MISDCAFFANLIEQVGLCVVLIAYVSVCCAQTDLKELNVTLLGHRMTMFKSIKELRSQQEADDEFEF